LELVRRRRDDVCACEGELIKNGKVAEDVFHAIRNGVIESRYEISAVNVQFLAVYWLDTGLGEEGAEFTAAADFGYY